MRSALLAKRYAGKSTKEDNSRLDILTERIRRLSPRVTEIEVDTLASIVDEAEAMATKLDDLKRKYGMAGESKVNAKSLDNFKKRYSIE